MNKHLPVASVLAFAFTARASHAEAERPAPIDAKDAERFGDARNVVIGGDFAFSLSRSHVNDEISSTSVGVSPSVDYFIIDHLSVGTAVTIAHSKWSTYGYDRSLTTMAIAPRIGYEIPLGSVFSLWPTVGVVHSRVLADDYPYADYTGTWSLNGYVRAPLLAHVAKHFFLGGGPSIVVKLADSTDTPGSYDFGFNSMLGGWF